MCRKFNLGHLLVVLAISLSTVTGFGQRLVNAGPATISVPGEPEPVAITLPQGGRVDRVKVLTDGSENLDFRLSSETCVTSSDYLPNQSCTVNVIYQPLRSGKRRGSILLLSSSGEALAARPLAATVTGPIANFISGQITTVAGNSAFLFSGDGGPATSASLFLPFGMTLDGSGNLYIADTYNERVRRVDHATGNIQTIAGDGIAGYAGDGGPGTSAHLNQPSSVALDAAGNVYISDTGNELVRVLNAQTGVLTTVAGTAGTSGYMGDNGPATLAELQSPNGLALDDAGNLYIADTGNNVVRAVNLTSRVITTFAGTGASGKPQNGVTARNATFNAPWGLAFDASGNLDIADQKNNVIRQVSVSGLVRTIAGNGSSGYSGDTSQATSARLSQPSNITFDGAGNLYIADTGNNRIRKVNPINQVISTVAGDNSTSLQGDGFPATVSALYGPYAVAVDGNANIFIADVFHNRIREVPSDLAILTYPTLRVNTVSDTLNQTIENDGTAPLNLTAITNVADGIIQPATTCSTTTPLAPLAQCVLAIAFSSSAVGTPVKGSIQITSDALNGPNTLLLQANVTSTSASTVILSSSPDPSIFGNPVTFTIQVVGVSGIPTGTVTLFDGPTQLGTPLTLNNSLASTTLSDLAVGSHTLTATYSGDVNNSSSTSLPITQVVKVAPLNSSTITSITTSANPIAVGQSLTVTITVAPGTSGQTVPTGTVTLYDGPSLIGTATLSMSSGVLTTSSLTAGTHCLTATYSGDSVYTTSNSGCFNEFVTTSAPATGVSQFSLTATPSILSLVRGSHATLQIAIAPLQDFSDTLSFGCGGLPADATCTFSRSQVPVTGGVNQSVTLVFDTASPLGAGSSVAQHHPAPMNSLLATGVSLGALCLLGFGRRRRSLLKGLCVVLSVCAALTLTGCGSLSTNATPTGTYTVQIFASGVQTGASSYVNLPVTITQ